MQCPVCNDANAITQANPPSDVVTVRCSRCQVFMITPEAVLAIWQFRNSSNRHARAHVQRLARHLASCQQPRPEVITKEHWDEWTSVAPADD